MPQTTTASMPQASETTPPRVGFSEWIDQQTGKLFVLPAVVILLAFAIFPLLISAYLSLTKFKLAAGGFSLSYVGLRNFKKLFFGSQQYHLLGTFDAFGIFEWAVFIAALALVAYWFWRFFTGGHFNIPGLIGRLITATVMVALLWLTLATVFGGHPGSLVVTLFYVLVGVSLQFGIGLGLALLCGQAIRGRNAFRIIFFIPLMVTPVGIAYMFRMLADMQRGPLANIWQWFGLGEFSWAADPWTARLVVLIGDTWQWVPFMFIVLLAAVENMPRDQLEAAKIDGAGGWQIFRDITWPSIAPVAATIVLIRLIEAFKIVDLPNVLTNGGPGIATESLTLHSFIAWRTQDLGGSAAVGYTLLFVATVSCVSFFNFIGQKTRKTEL
ncbi:carbohydrate ABC transporter permease [Hoeflea sp. TYP-13]|uniref:carbohydrate ABC transporter permease n=1 Tax=Hoeflea sp. TYP-13 TaxID=3230023 RepID=UPI0034C64C47